MLVKGARYVENISYLTHHIYNTCVSARKNRKKHYWCPPWHYSDITWTSPKYRLFVQQLIRVDEEKENTKLRIIGPLWGQSMTSGLPLQRANNVESVSIQWRCFTYHNPGRIRRGCSGWVLPQFCGTSQGSISDRPCMQQRKAVLTLAMPNSSEKI